MIKVCKAMLILVTPLDIQEIQLLETSSVLDMVKKVYCQFYGHMKICLSQKMALYQMLSSTLMPSLQE